MKASVYRVLLYPYCDYFVFGHFSCLSWSGHYHHVLSSTQSLLKFVFVLQSEDDKISASDFGPSFKSLFEKRLNLAQ